MTGGFWPLVGPSAGGFLHPLEQSGHNRPSWSLDPSIFWRNPDSSRAFSGKILPAGGRIGTMRGWFEPGLFQLVEVLGLWMEVLGLWMACWREESSSVWRDLPGETAFGVLLFQWVGDLGL